MCRAKRAIYIDENKMGVLHIDDHIGQAISIYILKRESDWCKILSLPDEYRSSVNSRFRGVPPRKLDYDDMVIQIKSNEVTWVSRRVIVTNNSVGLERARAAKMQIVLGYLPPISQSTKGNPANNHDKYSQADKYKPVQV